MGGKHASGGEHGLTEAAVLDGVGWDRVGKEGGGGKSILAAHKGRRGGTCMGHIGGGQEGRGKAP